MIKGNKQVTFSKMFFGGLRYIVSLPLAHRGESGCV